MNKHTKSPFSSIKILVAGETCLDTFIQGDVTRLSPEAPIPIILNPFTIHKLGMSANVAANIMSLGGEAGLITYLGEDEAGVKLLNLLKEGPQLLFASITEKGRPTIEKTRILAGSHPLARLDREENRDLSEKSQKDFVDLIVRSLSQFNALILQDYGKGLWTAYTVSAVIEAACEMSIPVYVDPAKGRDAAFYYGASVIKANAEEAKTLSMGEPAFLAQAEKISEISGALVVLTRGADTAAVAEDGKVQGTLSPYSVPGVDVTGAGDTFLAALTLGCAIGMRTCEAVQFAHAAAAVALSKVGPVAVEWNAAHRIFLEGDIK